MPEKSFRIPEYEYFRMGGKYSGCKRGTDRDDFNYRINPEGNINIEIWYDIKCFEKSEVKASCAFELTREGYKSACEWIEEQFTEWLKGHSLLDPSSGYFCNTVND